MGMDPSDDRCIPFYNKMKELDMVGLFSLLRASLYRDVFVRYCCHMLVKNTLWMLPLLITDWEIHCCFESKEKLRPCHKMQVRVSLCVFKSACRCMQLQLLVLHQKCMNRRNVQL